MIETESESLESVLFGSTSRITDPQWVYNRLDRFSPVPLDLLSPESHIDLAQSISSHAPSQIKDIKKWDAKYHISPPELQNVLIRLGKPFWERLIEKSKKRRQEDYGIIALHSGQSASPSYEAVEKWTEILGNRDMVSLNLGKLSVLWPNWVPKDPYQDVTRIWSTCFMPFGMEITMGHIYNSNLLPGEARQISVLANLVDKNAEEYTGIHPRLAWERHTVEEEDEALMTSMGIPSEARSVLHSYEYRTSSRRKKDLQKLSFPHMSNLLCFLFPYSPEELTINQDLWVNPDREWKRRAGRMTLFSYIFNPVRAVNRVSVPERNVVSPGWESVSFNATRIGKIDNTTGIFERLVQPEMTEDTGFKFTQRYDIVDVHLTSPALSSPQARAEYFSAVGITGLAESFMSKDEQYTGSLDRGRCEIQIKKRGEFGLTEEEQKGIDNKMTHLMEWSGASVWPDKILVRPLLDDFSQMTPLLIRRILTNPFEVFDWEKTSHRLINNFADFAERTGLSIHSDPMRFPSFDWLNSKQAEKMIADAQAIHTSLSHLALYEKQYGEKKLLNAVDIVLSEAQCLANAFDIANSLIHNGNLDVFHTANGIVLNAATREIKKAFPMVNFTEHWNDGMRNFHLYELMNALSYKMPMDYQAISQLKIWERFKASFMTGVSYASPSDMVSNVPRILPSEIQNETQLYFAGAYYPTPTVLLRSLLEDIHSRST